MTNWKEILLNIYTPEIGSLWAAQNKIWNKTFAANKDTNSYHPTVVGNVSQCKTYCYLVPGTSKNYRKGSCVFQARLKPSVTNYPDSYFLIDLWMTFSKSDLLKLKQGWDGILDFSDEQMKAFKMQIKFCNGINV